MADAINERLSDERRATEVLRELEHRGSTQDIAVENVRGYLQDAARRYPGRLRLWKAESIDDPNDVDYPEIGFIAIQREKLGVVRQHVL